MSIVPATLSPDEQLADELAKFYADPLGYVMFAFPWDTDPSIQVVELHPKYRDRFASKYGPDLWACEFLDDLGLEIQLRGFDGKTAVEPNLFSTVSGHGIGKSALVAWLVKFILDTRPFSVGTVTAMTDTQLKIRTWAEVGKWHHISVTSEWFRYASSKGAMALEHRDADKKGRWRCDARTCKEENSEAFAGQHAPTATSFYIFDEASGIANKIYEVREGGFSDGEPMAFDFGNGTRNSGMFFENCVGRFKHRYNTRSIDSRSVQITNKTKIAKDIQDWGEDSDFIRVRVKGQFPAAGNVQFISTEDVLAAMNREMLPQKTMPLVLGVDVARFGDDESVIYPRLGTDARSFAPTPDKGRYRGLDTVQLVGKIIETINEFKTFGIPTSAIFIDETGGLGAGPVDQLRHLGYNVIGISSTMKVTDTRVYRFKSDEMWGVMRDNIKRGLILPMAGSDAGEALKEQLTQREYGFTDKGLMHLESKPDMKSRGLPSPDIADALALTYAFEVAPQIAEENATKAAPPDAHDYDPYERND